MSANITLKVSREIKEFQEYEKLMEGFRQPLRGQTPGFLGREVTYNHPHTPPTVKQFLRHIHLGVPLDEHPLWWKQVTDMFRRINPKKAPEKDHALVYCYDDLQYPHYLLTIIGPDAHNHAKWMSYLKDLAIEAERLMTRSSAFSVFEKWWATINLWPTLLDCQSCVGYRYPPSSLFCLSLLLSHSNSMRLHQKQFALIITGVRM